MPVNDAQKLPFFLNEKDIARWVGRWHAHRRVFLGGELNAESLKKATLQLAKLEDEESAPITLMIESGGGDVRPTHQFEDMINALNSPVDALVIGNCASMAVYIVQMCRKRLMLPSSRVLVHYIKHEQGWICDDLDQLEVDIQYFRERAKEIRDRRLQLYMKRTGLSEEKLKELFRHGETHRAYFSAQQALALNLADEIVADFKLFPSKPGEDSKS